MIAQPDLQLTLVTFSVHTLWQSQDVHWALTH